MTAHQSVLRLRGLFGPGLVLALAVPSVVLGGPTRTLTFEKRVRAQEAIERVYYAHQTGATEPFEKAVPRAVLEAKVRKYLKQSAALSGFWKTRVTGEMLHRELERMAAGTRMPERLLQLYAALGNAPLLVEECLARQTLVDRLSRNFFAFDPLIHANTRWMAESVLRDLEAGTIDPRALRHGEVVNGAQVSEMVLVERKDAASPVRPHVDDPQGAAGPRQLELRPQEFRRQRAMYPEQPDVIPSLSDDGGEFVIRLVLREGADDVQVVTLAVAKESWDDWWQKVEAELIGEGINMIDRANGSLPIPNHLTKSTWDTESRALPSTGIQSLDSTCAEDIWDNGSLDDVSRRTLRTGPRELR